MCVGSRFNFIWPWYPFLSGNENSSAVRGHVPPRQEVIIIHGPRQFRASTAFSHSIKKSRERRETFNVVFFIDSFLLFAFSFFRDCITEKKGREGFPRKECKVAQFFNRLQKMTHWMPTAERMHIASTLRSSSFTRCYPEVCIFEGAIPVLMFGITWATGDCVRWMI